jgi:ubiquinol-cytochrome c reductase cytochrome b subunit
VPKRMNQLGAGTPFRHIRGFFYPVKEKPEIQAALDELEASEADQHDRQHQLTD